MLSRQVCARCHAYKFAPKSRLHKIYVALQYLIVERYDASLELLDSLTHHTKLTEKENEVLMWMLQSKDVTKDGTAEAAAISFKVLQIVHANSHWHPGKEKASANVVKIRWKRKKGGKEL